MQACYSVLVRHFPCFITWPELCAEDWRLQQAILKRCVLKWRWHNNASLRQCPKFTWSGTSPSLLSKFSFLTNREGELTVLCETWGGWKLLVVHSHCFSKTVCISDKCGEIDKCWENVLCICNLAVTEMCGLMNIFVLQNGSFEKFYMSICLLPEWIVPTGPEVCCILLCVHNSLLLFRSKPLIHMKPCPRIFSLHNSMSILIT